MTQLISIAACLAAYRVLRWTYVSGLRRGVELSVELCSPYVKRAYEQGFNHGVNACATKSWEVVRGAYRDGRKDVVQANFNQQN